MQKKGKGRARHAEERQRTSTTCKRKAKAEHDMQKKGKGRARHAEERQRPSTACRRKAKAEHDMQKKGKGRARHAEERQRTSTACRRKAKAEHGMQKKGKGRARHAKELKKGRETEHDIKLFLRVSRLSSTLYILIHLFLIADFRTRFSLTKGLSSKREKIKLHLQGNMFNVLDLTEGQSLIRVEQNLVDSGDGGFLSLLIKQDRGGYYAI